MDQRLVGTVLGLLGLVFVLGAVGVAVWGDDALEHDVQKALRVPERLPREVNLFNPISGFGVAENKDPAEEGYAAITRVNELLAASGPSDEQTLREKVRKAWVVTALTLADHENILCSPKENGCVAQLWHNRDELRALGKAHQTLLQRYRVLMEFTEFRMELHPYAEMPLPEFPLILATHRLWLGIQAASYLEGKSGRLRAVLDDLRFLRRVLTQADDLLTKMVATSMVVEDLHVYAALMDWEDAVLDEFPEVGALSAEETSLESAWQSEFRFITSVLLTRRNEPETYEQLDLRRWLGAFALRPFFKPNRTVNSAYRCWQKVRETTRWSAADAMAGASPGAGTGCQHNWSEWISNPVGTMLVSTAEPDVRLYTARLQDLRGLVSLVNLKRSIRRAGIGEDRLEEYLSAEGARFIDPYMGKPMLWNKETRTLYFTSARPRSGYHRLPLEPLERVPKSGPPHGSAPEP